MNRNAILVFLYFLSGAAALADEVLFSRLLQFTFGASIHAVAAVTAAFLCGLGLGAGLLGGVARRSRRPVAAYGLMELGIGLMVPCFPALSKAITPAVASFLSGVEPGSAAFGLARFAAAFLLLLPPAFFMGGTFPFLVRAAVTKEGPEASRDVGILYGANTLGAGLGALGAGFLLLPRFGYGGTVWIAAALSGAAGLAALGLGGAISAPPAVATGERVDPEQTGPAHPWTAAALVTLGGAVSLDLQITWTRLLTQVFGATVYAFALVLALFLVGLALGAALLPGFVARKAPGLRGLALLCAAAAGAVGVGILVFRAWFLPGAHLGAVDNALPLPGSSFTLAFLGHGVRTAAIILPPTFFLGALLPAAAGPGAGRGGLPRYTGLLYGASCAGSIAGALGAGFFLVPHLSSEGALMAGGTAILCAAVLILAAGQGTPGAGRRAWILPGAALLLLGGAAAWRPGGGPRTRVLFFEEGPAATAKVEAFDEGGETVRGFRINGKVVATTGFLDRRLQLLLGYGTALCHPAPRSVLSVGLGTGMSSGALAAGAGPDATMEIVELSSAVIHGAARCFGNWNHHVLEGRARITRQDGRNRLLLAKERFDVIAADPIHPWVAGSGNLYTLEYFSLAADRLNEGGVMAQWVPLYQLSAADVRTVLATFHAVFPGVRVFLTGYDLVVVGSRSGLHPDPRAWRRRAADPVVAKDLASIGIHDAEDLFAAFLFGERGLEAFLGTGMEINRDADQTLEYSAPKGLWKPYDEELLHDLLQAAEPLDGLAPVTEWPEALYNAATERRFAYLAAVKRLFLELLQGRAGARKRFREALQAP